MFGITIPASITKSASLIEKASTRHLDEALAKEATKQEDHKQAIAHYAVERKAHRSVRANRHVNKVVQLLASAEVIDESTQSVYDAFTSN